MKEELPNIISKFRGKGICSLNKNSTSQFKFFLAWLFLFLGITETFAGPRDFLQALKIAQQKALRWELVSASRTFSKLKQGLVEESRHNKPHLIIFSTSMTARAMPLWVEMTACQPS